VKEGISSRRGGSRGRRVQRHQAASCTGCRHGMPAGSGGSRAVRRHAAAA
jgi:hypothetical protein